MTKPDVVREFVPTSDDEEFELARKLMRNAIRHARNEAEPVRRPQNLEEVDPHLGLIVRESRI